MRLYAAIDLHSNNSVLVVNPLPSGKEQCGAVLRGHACDDISRISSAYRFQRRQGSRIVAGERLLADKISNTMFSG